MQDAPLAARKPYPPGAVDVAKVEAIVGEAAPMRNGWKHVLERCAPATPRNYRLEWRRVSGEARVSDGRPTPPLDRSPA